MILDTKIPAFLERGKTKAEMAAWLKEKGLPGEVHELPGHDHLVVVIGCPAPQYVAALANDVTQAITTHLPEGLHDFGPRGLGGGDWDLTADEARVFLSKILNPAQPTPELVRIFREARERRTPALNEHEIRIIESGDLLDAVHTYGIRTNASPVVVRRVVLGKWRELKGLPAPTVKFFGQYDEAELPLKRGMMVTIRKGTVIHTTDAKHRTKVATRTYKVKIDHILPGVMRHINYHQETVDFQNPTVRWVGTGGFWYEVDINDVPEAVL